MRNFFLSFLLLLHPILLGCQLGLSQKERPSWVDEVGTDCKEGHFCALGSGDVEELARVRSMANLAKIFENQISARFETNLSSADGEENENSEDSIVESTQVILEGAEIKKTFFDERRKEFYAFAEISKSKLNRLIRKDIESLDEEIKGLLVNPTLGKLSKIEGLLNRRIPFERKAQFLSGASLAPPISKEALAKKRQELQKKVELYFEAKETGPIKFLPLIKEAFSKAGFRVVSSDRNRASHFVHVTSSFEEEYLKVKGFKKQNAKIGFSILSKENERSLTVNLEYSETGRTLEQIKTKINEKFKEEITEKISEFDIE